MRVAFVCGSLEPGLDGVGDYTRLLAGELVRLGHQVLLVALNDRWAAGNGEGQRQAGMETWRFAPGTVLASRVAAARKALERFAPDWVSLQFVCYGFHEKGLPWRWIRALKSLFADGAKLHVMFHELWIGEARQSPLRERIIGAIQRSIVVKLVQRLKPALIHTHTPLYAAQLQERGIATAILPLFGNIPIMHAADGEWPLNELQRKGCSVSIATRSNYWIGGIFGNIPASWNPVPILKLMTSAGEKTGKQVIFVAFGRIGQAGEKLWHRIESQYSHSIGLANLGELEPPQLSQVLQIADFGIATTPFQLLSKSGTAAAMLDHGLPIITMQTEEQSHVRISPSMDQFDPLVYTFDDSLEEKLISGLKKGPLRQRLPETAAAFCSHLMSRSRPS